MTILAFVGTLNRPAPYFRSANGTGIDVLAFDEASGAMTPLHKTTGVDNPSYLTISPDGAALYATSEVYGWHEGIVTAYRIEPTGALTYINKQPTRGSISAQASFDHSGRWLLVANYRMGEDGARPAQAVVVYPIEADRGLGPAASSVGHVGHGPDPDRQEGPHPHCVRVSPDNRHALVADLGLDRVFVYSFDAATGHLAPAAVPFLQLAPGSGPRHLAWHPSGRFLYAINELRSSVTVLAWDGAAGALRAVQTVTALPEGWTGVSHCSEVLVTRDGRFLYGANRGHDSIVGFAIDPDSGELRLVGHHSTLGATPRQFAFDPDERFLLIANQDADAVVVLARDPATGILSDTGQRAAIGTPMCVKLVRT